MVLVMLVAFLAQAVADERPNIIYILLDDAGYGDFGCYGQKKFETPNIDKLAANGMRFTQHYSGSTVCAPSRCSLMTGMHTGHTIVRGNREIQPEGQHPIPGNTDTFSKRLQKAGYVCGAFGKWGMGPPGSVGEPNRQGFDTFYGYNCQRQAHTYYPDHLWSNREKVKLDGKTYSHDLIMDQALKFVESNQDKKFFCFMPVTIPHAAMHVPSKYSEPFRKKFAKYEEKIGKYRGPDVKNPIAAFAGMMTKMDEDVGRLMALLEKLEIADNTIVMISSDNGPHLEGGHDPRFFDSNGPLKGHKRDLYEGGVRVPLIVHWPSKIKAGTDSDHISAHWDLFPTFCELAKAEIPKSLDGISFAPTLLGKAKDQKQHDYLYWEFYSRGGAKAARFGNWKAVYKNFGRNKDAKVELYNLAKDIGETKNVAAQHPDLVAKAEKIFSEAHVPSDIWKFKTKR